MKMILRLFPKLVEPQTFHYHWLNLRTKRRGIKTIECRNRHEFHDKLAAWNSADPDHWKYWEVTQ